MAQQNVFDYIAFSRKVPKHLEPYTDLMYLQLEVDLLDAIDLRVINANYFTAHHDVISASTTFRDMVMSPQCVALSNRLRTMGVPLELRQIIQCEWVLQWVTIVSN